MRESRVLVTSEKPASLYLRWTLLSSSTDDLAKSHELQY